VTAELLARLGGPVAACGLAVLVLGGSRFVRLGGLAVWGVGMALFLPFLAPGNAPGRLAAAAVAGLAVSVVLALVFRRWPWAIAVGALGAAPVRVPVTIGDTSANLLIPLYAIAAGAALALAWSLFRDEARVRELGPLAWPAALTIAWLGLSALWTSDVREASITLFFFMFPFLLLAVCFSRLRWQARPLAWLVSQLTLMALVFAAVGVWQWVTRDVFWNPKVIVGNVYAPFYRVNSVFWDPSIYGRFLVVAILVALALLLFRVRPRWDLLLVATIIATWVGLLFSFSQSSFAALVVGVAVASVLAWRWRAFGAIALVGAVMVVVGFTSPQLEDVRDSVFGSSATGLNQATSGRTKLVGNGLRIALDHPVVGVGVGGFKDAYVERLNLKRAPPSAASHNTPVTVAAETGLIGLALFAWLVATGLQVALRGNRAGETLAAKTGIVAGLGIIAILVHSLFYNAFFEDPMIWGLFALAALAAAQPRQEAVP
jgi:putative inorganic carbon (HCO3(-)) transporter